MRELFGVMDIFYNLIVVVVTWWLTFIITHRTVHLKRVNFTIYRLCLNKLDSPQKKKKKKHTAVQIQDIIHQTLSVALFAEILKYLFKI